MLIGIIFIIAAFLLYTISIWSERLSKQLKLWMVIMMATGFTCDIIGTTIMRLLATTHTLNLHTAGGYTALLIMGLHLIWAILAIRKFKKAHVLFKTYSIYAWILWILVFITGIPKI